jgi:nucleoside-diphosphate-sugar epimerase
MEDLTAAVRAVIAKRPTGCYNVCSGRSVSITEMLRFIGEATGREVPVLPQPPAPWDVQSSRLSNEKFQSATGWTPDIQLEAGVASLARAAIRSGLNGDA